MFIFIPGIVPVPFIPCLTCRLYLTAASVDVYAWRHSKSERLSKFGQVERIDIKYLFERVGGIGLKIGSESVFGRLVEVIVFAE